MSVDNIVSLADARAARPAKAPIVPAHAIGPDLPAGRGVSGDRDAWQAEFERMQAEGQYAAVLVIADTEPVGGLSLLLDGALAAGWKPTTLQSQGDGAGVVVGMAVAARVIDGGAS